MEVERGEEAPALARARARASWAALAALRDRRSGLYLEPRRGGALRPLLPTHVRASSVWPFANAWAAALAMATLPAAAPQEPPRPTGAQGPPEQRQVGADLLAAHVGALAAYADRRGSRRVLEAAGPLRLTAGAWQPPGTGGEAYYDDNAWIALDLLAQHRLVGDERLLVLARRALTFVLSGWSDEQGWARPGGIRWAEPSWSRTRNACSNAPAAEAALLLAGAAGDSELLERAEAIIGWLEGALLASDGLVEDRIEPDGTIKRQRYTYNQGTTIGALVLSYEATGAARHLEQAAASAAACATWIGGGGVLDRQPPEFNAIYLRNVLRLARHADVSANVAQVAAWAARAWEEGRHESTGLFSTPEPSVNDTAGMAAVYALLAGADPAP